jgi:hypothetical protein
MQVARAHGARADDDLGADRNREKARGRTRTSKSAPSSRPKPSWRGLRSRARRVATPMIDAIYAVVCAQ